MSIVNVLELPSCAIARRGWIGSDNDWLIEQSRKDGQRLFVALEDFERLRAENERLQSELTALRRPVVQSEAIEGIRKIRPVLSRWAPVVDGKAVADTLFDALDQTQRELSAVRAAANKQGDGDLAELERLRAEIARLSSPPEERGEITARQAKVVQEFKSYGWLCLTTAEHQMRDIDTLLGDCAAWRNAHALVTAERDEARGKLSDLLNQNEAKHGS